MKDENEFRFYAGSGETISERGVEPPDDVGFVGAAGGGAYLAQPGLRDAVNVALLLGQPLLVTGEPGTGKTQLAYSVAHELELYGPLIFNTKTTSAARDLFYRYDALAHFRDARFQEEGELASEKYISYEALGLAILLSHARPEADPLLPAEHRGRAPVRSVVLVDEIDKAPRDFPNDLLHELDQMTFTVRETGRSFAATAGARPVVILTSNSEKNLPEPFLRRCVFYHIPFPETKEELEQIVSRRLSFGPGFTRPLLDHALAHFLSIRGQSQLRKKPATAELLAWLRVLEKRGIDAGDPAQARELLSTYPVLAKTREDLEALRAAYGDDRKGP